MALYLESKLPIAQRSEIVAKIYAIAAKHSFRANDLMRVMWKESRLNPKERNPKSTATGLIQWMAATARNVHGITTATIYQMSFLQQLDLVDSYYSQPYLKRKSFRNAYDVYFAVFMPALIGKNDNYVVSSKGEAVYNANSGLDTDNDGVITVRDIQTWFDVGFPDYIIQDGKKNRFDTKRFVSIFLIVSACVLTVLMMNKFKVINLSTILNYG
jgi:hypothetical protein